MRQELTLATLKDFDSGKAAVAWELAFKRILADIKDRPLEATPRKLVLTTIVTPRPEQDGAVVDADVSFLIETKAPGHRTAARQVGLTRSNQAYFNDLAPDNPHQSTVDEAQGE